MSKRKNPLKDLDSFLKQEASSFVEPDKIPSSHLKEDQAPKALRQEEVIVFFQQLANEDEKTFRTTLIDIVRKSLEWKGLEKAEDKMLMNTLLYFENHENWKEAISDYWSTR